jgi:flavin-dependent thymidylate synthase
MAADTHEYGDHDQIMPHKFDAEGNITECPPNCPAIAIYNSLPKPIGQVVRWADRAMFRAEVDPEAAAGEAVTPRATLISQTPNPLRVMAAAAEMYRGHVVRDASAITQDCAKFWFDEAQATKLKAGLEFIDLHFLVEGVTRNLTHQMVRQRTAVYVQESLRFAVKDNAAWEVAIPPSLYGLKEDDPRVVVWKNHVLRAASDYMALINGGIPSEDARGILPMNITTRLHYKTNLRNLMDQAGNRLCTQAQQEWKLLWNEMIAAIRDWGPPQDRWQQREIIKLFKPVCYQTGSCGFHGENDRWCAIRDRVDAHSAAGDHPTVWLDINPLEPLMYGAAIQKPE